MHSSRTAVVDTQGTFTYNELLDASSRVATALLAGRQDLQEERVAFFMKPGFPWVAAQWGIWRAGGVAVPLPAGSTRSELEYIIDDTGASTLVFDAAAEPLLALLAAARSIRALPLGWLLACPPAELPDVTSDRRAMILYTSGTTSRPKGVVTTHANIAAQIVSLVEAWEWSADDRILLCLPLHHLHGIINVVSCALWSGAACAMLPRFEANSVWEHICGGRITLFMAVPTIYVKLIAAWEAATPERRAALEQRLDQQVRRIADRSVQEHYRSFFRERLAEAFNAPRRASGAKPGSERRGGGRRRFDRGSGAPPWREVAPAADPSLLLRRREEVMLALILNHPFLLNEVAEEFAGIELASRDLDRLRDAILKRHALQPDLDAGALKRQLREDKFAKVLDGVLSAEVLNHAAFARLDVEPEAARRGWMDATERFEKRRLGAHIKDVERDLARDMSVENWTRMQPLLANKDEKDGTV